MAACRKSPYYRKLSIKQVTFSDDSLCVLIASARGIVRIVFLVVCELWVVEGIVALGGEKSNLSFQIV